MFSRRMTIALTQVSLLAILVATGAGVAEEAVDEPLDNRLKWSTASEVDNFGYDVYRGDIEEGPFERITVDPMPGNGTTDEPSYYEFADVDIDPTQDYYYYVESIALDGTRERFTPIIRAKAKRPLETTDDAAATAEGSDESGAEVGGERLEEAGPEESGPEEPVATEAAADTEG